MFQRKQEEDKLINDSVHVYWKAIAIRSSNESSTPLALEERWGKNTANATSGYQSVVKSVANPTAELHLFLKMLVEI